MSDRDRLLDTATRIALIVFLVLVLAIQFGELGEPLRLNVDRNEQNQEQRREEQALLWCSRLNASEESEAARQCEQARAYADLRAQREMAIWAHSQTRISFLGLLGLGLTVGLAWAAWRAATRANDLTREQFAVQRRAWLELSAEAVSWHRRRSKDGAQNVIVMVRISAKNVGLSPATGVWFFVPGEGQKIFLKENIPAFISNIEGYKRHAFENHGRVVFPGAEIKRDDTPILFKPGSESLDQGEVFVPMFVRYDTMGMNGLEPHATPVVLQVGYEYVQATGTYRIKHSEHWSLCPPPD